MDAKYWIETLGLEKHPEGGYFREIYRSDEHVIKSSLPNRYLSKRCFSTSIYYLLEGRDFSRFHRLQSDEIWHFYSGSAVNVYMLDHKRMTRYRVGPNPAKGHLPMLVIPRNTYFAADLDGERSYSLVGCTVSPGFDFEDFEQPTRSELSHAYPEHLDLIRRLTRS